VAFPRRLLFEGEDVVVELRPHWIFLGWPLVSYVLVILVAVPALWLVGRVTRWVSTSIVVTTTRILERWGVFARRSDEIRLEAVNQLSVHQNLFQRLFRVGNVFIEVPGRTGVIEYHCLSRPDVVQRIISEQVADLYHQGAPGGLASARAASRVVPPVEAGPAPFASSYSSPEGFDTPATGSPVVRDSGTTGGSSVVDAMAQLDELRRRGLLTDEEYDAKKAEVLRRL
jgi:hypothetical protein